MNIIFLYIERDIYIFINIGLSQKKKKKNMSIAHRFPKLGFIENSIFIQGSG